LRRTLKYLHYAPVIFLSALEGTGPGMARVLNEVKAVAIERRKRVSTGQMNRFLEKVDFQRAPVPMAKRIRIFYMTQAAVAPPTFILFTDRDIKLHFSFERFLENQIREAFGFKGTPIWFKVRARNAAAGTRNEKTKTSQSKRDSPSVPNHRHSDHTRNAHEGSMNSKKAGYAYVPYSSLESVIENSKEGYYLALRQTQGTVRTASPNWQPWLVFFLRSLQRQEQRLAAKVERERLTLTALPELSTQIIDHVRQRGRVTMAEMIRATGVSRNTLKGHFRSLVQERLLIRHGTGKGSWYALP
jgi:hypothetical protein